jgi:hypothetical protein
MPFPVDGTYVTINESMGRPHDSTALPPREAAFVRDLLQRGKKQYDLTWREIAVEADYGERSVRNYMSVDRLLPRRVAKALVQGVLDAKKTRAWRREHGCCSEHRTGEAYDCSCDPWATLLRIWIPTRQWLKRQPVPALLTHEAIDGLADELARFVCSKAGLGIGDSRRESAEKAFRSFLCRNGARFAGDAMAVMGFAYNTPRAPTTIGEAAEALVSLRLRVGEVRASGSTTREEKLKGLAKAYGARTVCEAALSYWPNAQVDPGVSLPERLERSKDGD